MHTSRGCYLVCICAVSCRNIVETLKLNWHAAELDGAVWSKHTKGLMASGKPVQSSMVLITSHTPHLDSDMNNMLCQTPTSNCAGIGFTVYRDL